MTKIFMFWLNKDTQNMTRNAWIEAKNFDITNTDINDV